MEILEPDWPAPARVRALTTTRLGGVSRGPYASLNLADHVGDEPSQVVRNRALLRECLGLPSEPRWLRQVHGCAVADIGALGPPVAGAAAGTAAADISGAAAPAVAAADASTGASCTADAAMATRAGEVCAVMTADCLPVLLCDRQGTRVAAVHAGWRGLAAGVVEAAVRRLAVPHDELLCWLGPAIGPRAFEVGPEVRALFLAGDASTASAFAPSPQGKWRADLYALARTRLRACGVRRVFGGGWCTHSDGRRFFSFRRDGVTGRMASLIWIL